MNRDLYQQTYNNDRTYVNDRNTGFNDRRFNDNQVIQRNFQHQFADGSNWNEQQNGQHNSRAGFDQFGNPYGTGNSNPDYYNPYEYGSRQAPLEARNLEQYSNEWESNYDALDDLGVSARQYMERFPGETKNVNIETPLIYGQMTKQRGNRRIMENPVDRFDFLYFNPQDPRHLTWNDMPRGGFSTRLDENDYK